MNEEQIIEGIIQIISAIIGSLGFSMLFCLKGKKLLWATLGGGIAWSVYLVVQVLGGGLFLCGVVSAMVATAYSEIFARILKTPKTAFIFPAIVPMVPGGGLYYTMSNALSKNFDKALKYASDTLSTAIALAFGIVVVIMFVKVVKHLKKKKHPEK